MKVETHNHPTAIAPFPGAATGSGGEIRDEGATGRGSKPKAGLCGFSVSNLRIPGLEQPWEQDHGKPERIASALDIMIEGPIGAAAFNNEFGRPNLAGYFRTFEQEVPGGGGARLPQADHDRRRPRQHRRGTIRTSTPRPVARCSSSSAARHADRPGRRRGLVAWRPAPTPPRTSISPRCSAATRRSSAAPGGHRPLLAARRGQPDPLRSTTSAPAASPTPCRSWCTAPAAARASSCAACPRGARHVAARDLVQRGAGALRAGHRRRAARRIPALCERERCPFAVVGEATAEEHLVVSDSHFGNDAVDMDMQVLLGKPPR
jgi:phosphoribosylformylglycinamidine synthase